MRKRWLNGIVFSAMTVLLSSAVSVQAADLNVLDINATSVLPTSEFGDYWARNMLDYNLNTAWVENAPGEGIGEEVTFDLEPDAVLTGVQIVDGYCKNEDIFFKNAAPTSITLITGGKSYTLDLFNAASDYYTASRGVNFNIPETATNGTVKIRVDGVRSGNKYTDTCISEFHLQGYKGNSSNSTSSLSVTEDTLQFLCSQADYLYQNYTHFNLQNANFQVSDLTSQIKAFALHHYQYFRDDYRINDEGYEFHSASISNLAQIMKEVFGSCSQQDMDAFLQQYSYKMDGNTTWMYATGDFGAAGEFFLREPVGTVNGNQLNIECMIMSWNAPSQTYVNRGFCNVKYTITEDGFRDYYTFQSLSAEVY